MIIYKGVEYSGGYALAKALVGEYSPIFNAVSSRINQGQEPEFAISESKRMRKRRDELNNITWKGKTQGVADWCREIGIGRGQFIKRYDTFGICEKTFRSKKQAKKSKVKAATGIKQKHGNWDLSGMQPRKPVSSLGKPGTWESKNLPKPTDGCGVGTNGRGGGTNSRGNYLIGD